MITVVLGRRGQLTLPRKIRTTLGINEGDHLLVIQEKDHVILRPLTRTLLDLRGRVAVEGEQDFNLIRQRVLAERVKKVANHEP